MKKDWQTITKEKLEQLVKENTNRKIAEIYDVTVNQVQYKRKKFGITIYNQIIKDMLNDENMQEIFNSMTTKDLLLNRLNIDPLSKALTQYAFCNGPIKNMYAQGKLTEDDMKLLRQSMVNKLAGLLQKAFDGEWEQISKVYSLYLSSNLDWDRVVPDTKDFENQD